MLFAILQALMASLPARKVELESLNERGEGLMNAGRDTTAAAALGTKLYQVKKRWEALNHRLDKWARDLGLDKV